MSLPPRFDPSPALERRLDGALLAFGRLDCIAAFLPDPDDVVAHVQRCRTNTVQLVDSVPVETYSALEEACPGVRIVQVVHVEDERAIDEAIRVSEFVDAVLLDSGRPHATVRELGGTGRTHDWSLSREIVERVAVPVFLAGGLGPGNVGEAIRRVGPFAVDLCSGVRTRDSLDEEKLALFVARVRRCDEVAREAAARARRRR